MMRSILSTTAGILFTTHLLSAQGAEPSVSTTSPPLKAYASLETLWKQVTEVSLTLSVTDQKGHFIGGLAQTDFTIFDNLRRQASITFFQNQTNLPLDIALVVDVSDSMAARFEAEQSAIDDFLREVIRGTDSGRVFAFNQTIEGTLPITHQLRKLTRSLKKVRTGGYTALYDAVFNAAEWLAQDSRSARRIMQPHSFDATVTSLLNSDAVVYRRRGYPETAI